MKTHLVGLGVCLALTAPIISAQEKRATLREIPNLSTPQESPNSLQIATMTTKTLLLICVLSFGFLNGCVTAPAPADQSDYAGFDYVTDINGLKKDAIYEGVELWIAENFKSAKHVIDLENKEQGIIVCNGVISNIILDMGAIKMPLEASFKMKVEVKDGKMRLSFSAYQITMRQNTILYKMEAEQIKAKLSKFGGEIATYLKTEKKSF